MNVLNHSDREASLNSTFNPIRMTNNTNEPPGNNCVFTAPLTPPPSIFTSMSFAPQANLPSSNVNALPSTSFPNFPSTSSNPSTFSYSPDQGFFPSPNVYPGVFAFQSNPPPPSPADSGAQPPPPEPTPSCSFTPFQTCVEETNNVHAISKPFGMKSCKRKTDSPFPPVHKQHITEEKMVQHMSRLHISSQTPSCSNEAEPVREQRLYMCDEMRKLQTESIIPVQLLAAVQRPCTALVPWQPFFVAPQNADSKENNNDEDEPDNNASGMEMDS